MQIRWTAAALRDLAALHEYIASNNPQAAARQVALLRGAITRLADFPEMGRIGRRPDTRELVVARTPYIVAYRARSGAIELLRIIHGRQRWPDRL